MAQNGFKRRLTAILSADVEGYSRLMRDDEEATIQRLTTYRTAMTAMIQQYRGRVVDAPGDNLLAEFTSVVDAVNCAVEIQRELAERNAELSEEHRMKFRIGVNLGDVFEEGERIYGDGVNIAARMESLAEGGGICISGTVYDAIESKIGLEYESLGEQEVKNIDKPVRVYRVLSFPGAAAHRVIKAKKAVGKIWRNIALAIAVILVVAGAVVIWNNYMSQSRPPVEAASVERMAFPLPDKPSIAVLPFVNMSEDAKQEYFSDGITEDLITDLSKISGLFVIARNSSFVYKGRSVKVREVAEELGVRYVLEGSVRRAGDQVRINAQLIDATTGGHLWAERYDGSLADVFALQDRVTRQIVSALAVNLTARERTLHARSETRVPEAYDAFLRGWAYYRLNTPEDYAEAVPYFEQAITLDPNYGRAYAALAAIHWTSMAKNDTSKEILWAERLGMTPRALRLQADRYMQKALEDPVPLTHQVASSVRSFQGRHEEAIAEAERAIELDANDPIGYEALATALIYAGRPAEGAEAIRRAMRLDPHYPSEYLDWLGLAQFGEGKFEETVESFRAAIQRNPDDDTALLFLVASYGHLGRTEDAKSTKSALNDLRAKREKHLEEADVKVIEIGIDARLGGPYTLKDVDLWPFKERADRERLRLGLAKAGVPAVADSSAESPREVAGATTVDAIAAKALFDRGASFVDARGLARYDLGHIPGAVLLDLKTDFNEANLFAVVGKDQEVVIYCQGHKCLRASRACAKAVSWGFTKVYYFRDGFPGWRAAGYPVATQ